MEQEFKRFIESADSILITSHISPDPDAVSSLLLAGTAIKANFPDKQVSMVLEEEPLDLDFLEGYENIEFGSLLGALKARHPDLFIILDGNNYDRCSRHDGDDIRRYVRDKGLRTVIIDHHEPADKDDADIFINRHQPATAQTVYEVFFHDLAYKKPKDAARTAMVGFYADTGGFVYLKDGGQHGVFEFAEELVSAGADIEDIHNSLSRLTVGDVGVLAELAGNTTGTDEYTYSFISDKFIEGWLGAGHTQSQLQRGTGLYLDEFVRNIDGRPWGFIVYRNTLQGENMYSVSFRAAGGSKDVAAIANKLGGGGHKPAAGAKFEASSIEDAIDKVKAAIASS